MNDDNEHYIHVYGQFVWHDSAAIIGTRGSLLALRSAIDAALAHGNGNGFVEAFAADGEGYDIQVSLVSSNDFFGLAHPYMDEVAQDKREGVKWPFDILVERGEIPTRKGNKE